MNQEQQTNQEEKMEQKKKTKKDLPSKNGLFFRLVISLYLVYMGFRVWGPRWNTPFTDPFLFFMGILMIVGGILAAGNYTLSMIKGRYDGGPGDVTGKNDDLDESREAPRRRITFSEEDEKELRS